MSDTNEQKKLPSQIIFENLKEFLRAKNAAHESIFKFHWKKMWPFNAKDFEKNFLNAVPAYLEALDKSCQGLSDIAQWKQDMLYKKIHHDAKLVRDSRDYNTLLKAYEKEQADLVRAGAFVQAGWMEVASKI